MDLGGEQAAGAGQGAQAYKVQGGLQMCDTIALCCVCLTSEDTSGSCACWQVGCKCQQEV